MSTEFVYHCHVFVIGVILFLFWKVSIPSHICVELAHPSLSSPLTVLL